MNKIKKEKNKIVYMVKIESDGRFTNYYMIEADNLKDAIKRTLDEQLTELKSRYYINVDIRAHQLYTKP